MRRSGGALYVLLVWSTSGLFATAGCALLLLMLATVVGPFRFGTLDAAQAARAIGIWLPQATGRPLPREIARRAEAWRKLARRDEPVIESHSLAKLDASGARLVILPDARQLDRGQLYLLRRYLEEGGGVLLTGSLGVRSPEGEWRGYELMQEILDVPAISPLEREQAGAISAFVRGPLSAGLTPSQAVLLRGEPGVPAIEVAHSELRWSRRGAALGASAGASRRLEIGRGRLVWIGPGPEAVFEAEQVQHRALEEVFRNAIAWARRRPTLEVLPWPRGAPFAAQIVRGDGPAPNTPLTPESLRSFERHLESAMTMAAESGEYLRFDIPAAELEARDIGVLVARLHAQLVEQGAWLATREQESAWSRGVSKVLVSMRRMGPRRLLVNVTSRGDRPLEKVALRLWINQSILWARPDQTTLMQDVPQLHYQNGAESIGIVLPPLQPDASLSFFIDFELRDSGDSV